MTPRQRKHLEAWLTVGAVLVVIGLFQQESAVVYGAFAAAGAYLYWNRKSIGTLRELRPTTAMQVLRNNLLWQVVAGLWALGVTAAVIYRFHFSSDFAFNPSLGTLFGLIAIPIVGPYVTAELQLYRRLGEPPQPNNTVAPDARKSGARGSP